MPNRPAHWPSKENEFKPNWEMIIELVKSGCTKDDVAAYFDVNFKTIDHHIKKKYDCTWTEFRDFYTHAGHASLRHKTYTKAVEEGDWQAIKHLRKHWFGEHDKMDVGFDPEKPVKFVLDMGKKLEKEENHDKSESENTAKSESKDG